ncbi:methyl-accepting chemotaxis protein [Shewanella insulae]|uniref:methyl-accepting chemotaxis protein n=1 Tax=Shewanella insulae TaxID=2681496 RepID=UPI001EFD22EC|nr:methyl-accepting chemotaxis protein [Shewanella insulae]MCG9714325.1 methyl-accepting chemotaxis protein [Shewanella insulae]MCG9740324.1 methyl-accepting chemotaxis protein [Shewanella insulae]
MLIRHKLLVSAAVSICSVIAMFGLQRFSAAKLDDLSHAAQQVIELEKDVLSLRRDEKDFFARLDLAYLDKHKLQARELEEKMASLGAIFERNDIGQNDLQAFKQNLTRYESTFAEIAELQKQIGLHPKDGLYGALRSAVHNVETLVKEKNEPELMVTMLQLRRNEKDFMLRRAMSYLDKFSGNLAQLRQQVAGAMLSDSVKGELYGLIDDYEKNFKTLVNKEQELGLDKDSGRMASLRDSIASAEKSLVQLKAQSMDAISAAEDTTVTISIVIFILIALVLIGFTLAIIRSIMEPVQRISDAISRIEATKDLTLRCDTKVDDEIGQIARHFNSMVESFQSLIREVLSSVEVVNHSCQELSENSMRASEGVGRQLNETDMVATAITEMGATIDEIASNTELAAERAGNTHDNAQQGQVGVEHTIEKIQALAAQLTDSAQVVSELEKDSETIGSVLDVIRGIAEQTNLLALNAAIEAARAGEQGRGFAVVADEVRSLAMRTQESTEEIAGIIQTLQSRTRSIVQLMEATQRQGIESADQAASAGALLEQINADVTNIMDMSTQIAAAIEEQSMVASEVNKNVVVIRDIAAESAQAADENAKASDDVKARTQVLYQAVSLFKI